MASKSICTALALLAASFGLATTTSESTRNNLLRSESSQEAAVSPHDPALLDAAVAFSGSGATAAGGSAVIIGSNGETTEGFSDSRNCADNEDSGQTVLEGGKGKSQTCGELMYQYRHYASASACTDKKNGALVRKNCQRSCGCCCEDGLHSGTHDDNGLEVTCAQLVLWTTELKFDYCADEQFGATIRENCRQLCCACDAGTRLDHLWEQAGERGVNKSIPYSQVRKELDNAMHRISQLAEGVEAMAGRVPGIMGIISGSTTAAPRPHGALGDSASTTPGSGFYDSPDR